MAATLLIILVFSCNKMFSHTSLEHTTAHVAGIEGFSLTAASKSPLWGMMMSVRCHTQITDKINSSSGTIQKALTILPFMVNACLLLGNQAPPNSRLILPLQSHDTRRDFRKVSESDSRF